MNKGEKMKLEITAKYNGHEITIVSTLESNESPDVIEFLIDQNCATLAEKLKQAAKDAGR